MNEFFILGIATVVIIIGLVIIDHLLDDSPKYRIVEKYTLETKYFICHQWLFCFWCSIGPFGGLKLPPKAFSTIVEAREFILDDMRHSLQEKSRVVEKFY